MKYIAIVLLAIVAITGLGWFFTANDLAQTRIFAPKFEDVRRTTFERSKAYRQGSAQELQNMQFEYEQADAEHKAALRSIILHRAADMPADAMPTDLYAFIQSLRNQN